MVLKQLVRDSQSLESVRDSSTIGEKQKGTAPRPHTEMDADENSPVGSGESFVELPEASFIERVCARFENDVANWQPFAYLLQAYSTFTCVDCFWNQVQRQLSQAAGGAAVGEQAARNAAARFFSSKLFSAQSAFRRDERTGLIRARLF